jgi:hypothetical protein
MLCLCGRFQGLASFVLLGDESLEKSLRDLDNKVDQIALRLASLSLPLPLLLPLFVLDSGIEFRPSGNVDELSELRGDESGVDHYS